MWVVYDDCDPSGKQQRVLRLCHHYVPYPPGWPRDASGEAITDLSEDQWLEHAAASRRARKRPAVPNTLDAPSATIHAVPPPFGATARGRGSTRGRGGRGRGRAAPNVGTSPIVDFRKAMEQGLDAEQIVASFGFEGILDLRNLQPSAKWDKLKQCFIHPAAEMLHKLFPATTQKNQISGDLGGICMEQEEVEGMAVYDQNLIIVRWLDAHMDPAVDDSGWDDWSGYMRMLCVLLTADVHVRDNS